MSSKRITITGTTSVEDFARSLPPLGRADPGTRWDSDVHLSGVEKDQLQAELYAFAKARFATSGQPCHDCLSQVIGGLHVDHLGDIVAQRKDGKPNEWEANVVHNYAEASILQEGNARSTARKLLKMGAPVRPGRSRSLARTAEPSDAVLLAQLLS